ncbi:MAG TPA: SDR family oxidoreductase [Steroidobacteraceae bacterium]
MVKLPARTTATKSARSLRAIVADTGNSVSQFSPFIQPHWRPYIRSSGEQQAMRRMMARLSDKVALVTGASRGIGRAIAKRLAEDGALVAINYATNADAAASSVAEIKTSGGDAFAVRAKLGSSSETDKLFSEFDEELKRRGRATKLDILVNNAGVGYFGMVSEATDADFDSVFTANTKTPFLVTKAALRYLGTGGRIINISSGASRRPGTMFGLYAMTKSAVDTMTLAFAAELGPRGITVNALAPGWTATDGNAEARNNPETVRNVESQTALGRLGTPEDIARIATFLASDDSGWITGQYIEASGGLKLL